MEQHTYRRQQDGEQHFQQQRKGHAEETAVLFRAFAPDQDDAEQLRQEQQHHGGGKQRNRQLRTPLRPHREQLPRLQEVLRLRQGMDNLQRSGEREEHKPQRCREIGHHARQEHRAVNRVHPFYQEQAEVHQVTVTPAAVTLELVQQVRRQLFVRSRQVVGNPDAPASTTHQRRFYEVMRQNRTGKRTLTRQRRQRTVFNERLHADNGVVTPVVRLTQLPEVQTGRKQRPVNTGGELLAARIKGVHSGRFWRGLNDTGVRVGLHQTHQTAQAVSAHDGVSIQHHHVAVLVTPATAEVIDVAAFTLHATTAATVEDLAFALHFCNQLHPRFLFRHADIRVVAVAQDVNVEMLRVACRLHGLPGRTQARKYAVNVLVTDRHNQRGTVLGIKGFIPDR